MKVYVYYSGNSTSLDNWAKGGIKGDITAFNKLGFMVLNSFYVEKPDDNVEVVNSAIEYVTAFAKKNTPLPSEDEMLSTINECIEEYLNTEGGRKFHATKVDMS